MSEHGLWTVLSLLCNVFRFITSAFTASLNQIWLSLRRQSTTISGEIGLTGAPIFAAAPCEMRKTVLVIGARGVGGREGGVEKFTEEFLSRLPEHCYATVLSLDQTADNSLARVTFVKVPKSTFFSTDKAFYFLYAIYIFATRRYDCVLILGINFGILVPLMRMMSTVLWRKTNIYVRSGSIDYLVEKWSRPVKAFIVMSEKMVGLADGVIAVSESIKRHLATRGIDSELIMNGLDRHAINHSEAMDHRGRDVVAIGRVTAQKNYRVIIEAAELLANQNIQIKIIGNADLSGEFIALHETLKAKPRAKVEFVGALERPLVLRALSKAALYINSSHHEGMSNAVLEAVQQGTPLLLSNIAANRDLRLPDRFYFDPASAGELSKRVQAALERPHDYIVSPELFDDWNVVLQKVFRFIQLDPPPVGVVGIAMTERSGLSNSLSKGAS